MTCHFHVWADLTWEGKGRGMGMARWNAARAQHYPSDRSSFFFTFIHHWTAQQASAFGSQRAAIASASHRQYAQRSQRDEFADRLSASGVQLGSVGRSTGVATHVAG